MDPFTVDTKNGPEIWPQANSVGEGSLESSEALPVQFLSTAAFHVWYAYLAGMSAEGWEKLHAKLGNQQADAVKAALLSQPEALSVLKSFLSQAKVRTALMNNMVQVLSSENAANRDYARALPAEWHDIIEMHLMPYQMAKQPCQGSDVACYVRLCNEIAFQDEQCPEPRPPKDPLSGRTHWVNVFWLPPTSVCRTTSTKRPP